VTEPSVVEKRRTSDAACVGVARRPNIGSCRGGGGYGGWAMDVYHDEEAHGARIHMEASPTIRVKLGGRVRNVKSSGE
jgi:hypothetical protein